MSFMSEKKPIPVATGPSPKICPVCGTPSYSSDGIHPQCSVSLEDKLLNQRMKDEQQAAGQDTIEGDRASGHL
jgi:hypothetical protein